MMSARSFGNYDLAGALADLIDNSIKAEAKNIWIRYYSAFPTGGFVQRGTASMQEVLDLILGVGEMANAKIQSGKTLDFRHAG